LFGSPVAPIAQRRAAKRPRSALATAVKEEQSFKESQACGHTISHPTWTKAFKGNLPAGAKATIAVTDLPNNRTVGDTQLRDAEALDLYLHRINHNLAALAEQCLSLRSILNAERDRLSKIEIVRDK
jgi:hypothetical protein